MTRMIEVKHVEPKEQVRTLIEGLINRLEERLGHFRKDSVSVHALFEENGSHTLYRTSVTCHIPGHMIAAREESRNAGVSIRKAFAELERQVARQTARFRQKTRVKRMAGPEPLEA